VAERATIARPYAKAAFEYARGAKAFAEWSRGLRVAAQIAADPRVSALSKSPSLTAADLAGLVTDVGGADFNAGMQNFVRVLAENHRLLLLPEIAAALDAAQSESLERALMARLKRQVRMQNSVDSSLLGGAIVRAGDLVIDGSLKGRLERLATELGS
jgi:F-type H+-transporting ATPase subunit delta